jgi:hypothetical protein
MLAAHTKAMLTTRSVHDLSGYIMIMLGEKLRLFAMADSF